MTNVQIYSVLRSVYKLRAFVLEPEFISSLVEYMVAKGYDSDDLTEMGRNKAFKFVEVITNLCPELQDEMFLVHLKVYLQSEMQKFKALKSYRE